MMRAASEDIDHHSTSLTKSKKNKFSTCSVEDRQEQLELEKKNGRPRRAWTTAEKHTLTELLHKILSDQEVLIYIFIIIIIFYALFYVVFG